MTDEENKQEEKEVEVSDKIKLGDVEYTQDELNDLVGLGKIAREAEEKYNIKVEGMWPKFQQTINENVKFREQIEESSKAHEQEQIIKKANEGAELSEEEQLKLAADKLRSMGFYTGEDVAKEFANLMAGRELLSDVNKLINEQSEAGNPKTSAEDLLAYMQENGIKNPQSAYKLKFEAELDAIRERKLGESKKDDFPTEGGSAAGMKEPTKNPITRANLTDALSDVLNRQS
jgi:hypothetical protein